MMQNLKILNKKEIKRILSMLEKQWGFKEELDYAFLETEKGKIYIANKEIFDLDLSKIKINSVGMYFAEAKNGIRLSIEGSQIVGPKAKKNVVELDDEEAKQWLKGEDLDHPTESDGFVILRHGDDFLGTGNAAASGRILNYVPKTRRITIH
jgi:NOL1/NOP2/fmu family ribosome biogenesis protein